MFVRIDHVEIVPEDFERSIAFYEDILDFEMIQREEVAQGPLREIAYLQLGDGVIELMDFAQPQSASEEPTIGYRALALEVESMEETADYLGEKGVQITWGPIDLGGSIRAEITDPDGLVIELREWRERPW